TCRDCALGRTPQFDLVAQPCGFRSKSKSAAASRMRVARSAIMASRAGWPGSACRRHETALRLLRRILSEAVSSRDDTVSPPGCGKLLHGLEGAMRAPADGGST